jgi:ribose transport system permease protein
MNDKQDAIKSEGDVAKPPAAAPAPLTELPRGRLRLPAETGPLLGLLGVFALFFILLAWRGQLGSFLSLDNLQQLMNRNTIPMVVVLGMLFIIVSGGIDLSVGSVVALSAVATVLVYQGVLDATHAPNLAGAAAMAAGVGVGGLCGMANGLAVAWMRLTPFVATLGMMSIARGLAYWLSGRTKITLGEPPGWVDALQQAGNSYLFFDPGVWSAVLLAVGAVVVLRFTVFGRYVYAIGSNEATARLCGVNVRWNKVAVYTLAGLLTGWAGVLAFAQGSGSGDPTVKVGLELEVIAAAVIGGASLRGGQGSVLGVLLGVLILGVLENGVNRCGVPLEAKYILIGAIVVGNTALSQWQRKRTG